MAQSGSEKQGRYKYRQENEGYVQIHPWIAMEDRQWFLDKAEKSRERKRNKGDNQ